MSGAPSHSASPILTDGQRRHLTASLDLIEAALGEMERLLNGGNGEAPRLLRRQVADHPPGLAERIREPIAQARAILAELVRELGLEPSRASSRRMLQALVMSSLVILEDSFAAKLRAYGDVHPALPGMLDGRLQRLHDLLITIGAALGRDDANPAGR